jgi:polyisoprenoid-binding protein YceI
MKYTRYRKLLLLPVIVVCLSCNNNKEKKLDSAIQRFDSVIAPAKLTAKKAQAWVIDTAESKVEFTIKNMGLNVNGSLHRLKGNIVFDKKNLKGSGFSGSVDVRSISTGIKKRDDDLMEPKFFNEKDFPKITFTTDSITADGDKYEANGKFMIKGFPKHVSIPFSFETEGNKGIFKSEFTLNRLDFDLGGKVSIMGNDIDVKLSIVTIKK